MGISIDMAHVGRFISEEHFDLFMIYFKQALVLNQLPDTNGIHSRFLDAIMMCKNLIVLEGEQGLSFFQQLNY